MATRNGLNLERRLRFSFRSMILLFCALLIVSFCFASPAVAVSASPSDIPYRLRLFHTHTGQRIDIVYRHGDTYDPEALAQLNRYLRDHRTGDVHEYDPRVFDLLHDLNAALGRP